MAARRSLASARPTAVTFTRALSSASHTNPPPSPNLTPDQIRRIGERTKSQLEDHLKLKTDVPASSLDPSSPAGPVDAEHIRRKRLLYRSKQRGWLEVDLLLGSWAAEHVFTLTVAECDEYEKLLNQETIDIFNIINGAMPPPVELEGSKILKRLQEYAMSSPFGKASARTYETVKDRTGMI
eukprot:evm.model.NODE_4805_length_8192_cov_19.876709.2